MRGEFEGEREAEDTEEKEEVERRTEKKREGKAGHLILARGDWCGGAQGPRGQEPAWPRRRVGKRGTNMPPVEDADPLAGAAIATAKRLWAGNQ